MKLDHMLTLWLCCAGCLGTSVLPACSDSAPARAGASNSHPPTTEPEAQGPLGSVAFLEGLWRGNADSGVWEEYWTSSEGGMMTGTARLIVNHRVEFFEFSRIERRGDDIVLIVQPKGGKPTEFVRDPEFQRARSLPNLTESERPNARVQSHDLTVECRMAAFANPSHVYPQRITYTRIPGPMRDRLDVQLSGVESGVEKRESLSLERVNGQPNP